jgi:hypothetical protein
MGLLYAAADLKNIPASPYKIVVGKSSSAVLTQLQEETGLVYLWSGNQIIAATEPLGRSSGHIIALKSKQTNPPVDLLKSGRSLDNHQYITRFRISFGCGSQFDPR